MAHPYHHALSSARTWGGDPQAYVPIHDWFDAHKRQIADFRYRMVRHHAEGIFACEAEFGTTITNSVGRVVPVRLIGEQHCREDFRGRIPTLADWVRAVRPEPWMSPNIRALMTDAIGADVYALAHDRAQTSPGTEAVDGGPQERAAAAGAIPPLVGAHHGGSANSGPESI